MIHAVHGLGILFLAEGIETQGEFEICRDLGFETAHGFVFGRPESAESLHTKSKHGFQLVSLR